MRTRIKVTDLTRGQWDHLQDNLPASYDMPEGAVRVCVEFELDPQMNTRHVEMPVRAFMALMTRLQGLQRHAEAALTPDAFPDDLEAVRNAADPARPVLPTPDQVRHLSAAEAVELTRQMNTAPPTCQHGATVIRESPGAFEGAEPVRDYADGCQSFGPYRSLDK